MTNDSSVTTANLGPEPTRGSNGRVRVGQTCSWSRLPGWRVAAVWAEADRQLRAAVEAKIWSRRRRRMTRNRRGLMSTGATCGHNRGPGNPRALGGRVFAGFGLCACVRPSVGLPSHPPPGRQTLLLLACCRGPVLPLIPHCPSRNCLSFCIIKKPITSPWTTTRSTCRTASTPNG